MKALILAAGRGNRLDELSNIQNKCTVEVNGKKTIEHVLDYVTQSEIQDIIIVVGYRAEDIINNYGTQYKGRNIKYVIQRDQHGLVHAIECAKETLAGNDFMLLLGDEIMQNPQHQAMIEQYRRDDCFVMCGILRVEDRSLIRRTYTLIQNDDNVVYRLIEKPRNPLSEYMGTGDCIFKNEIFDYIDYTPIHHERAEKELPDLIQCAIDDAKTVKSFIICEKYANINSKEDIAYAESFFK